MPYTHEQVPLTFGDESFTVDAGMVDLIRGLWALGIETTNCCQGTDKDWRSAYVAMEVEHFKRFLGMFEDEIEIARECRRSGFLQLHPGQNFVSCWHGEMRESYSTGLYPKGDGWVLNVGLHFPPSFVRTLTDAVTRRAAVA